MHNTVICRFQPADHVFGNVDDFPENKCYCAGTTCPKRGVFNVSKCQFGKQHFQVLRLRTII
jgi:hypothetical protein